MSLPSLYSWIGLTRPARPLASAAGKLGVFSLVLGAIVFAAAAQAATDDDEEQDAKPQDLSLKTSDGLELKLTYYPSTLKKKKEATVVVLLHAWKGDRGDCESLALFLQKLGHAVIAPDLRGHGESKYLLRYDGSKQELEASSLRKDDFDRMVTIDMEKIKDFIRQKNNDGELNMENLCVVGAEMGATITVRWCALDWAWPVLNTGKQGQDVKAMVLISPEWNFKGIPIRDALDATGRDQISCLLIAGGKGNSKAFQQAKQMNVALMFFHPEPPPEEAEKKKTLFFEALDTKLQGANLLNEKSLNVYHLIAKFIELRIVKQPTPWEERKKL